jgi:hypothetical protein
MGKSVTICGFASATRDYVYEWDTDEIWSLNVIHSSPLMRKIYPLNITRLFEIHPFWMMQSDWYCEAETDHWGWLTRVKHHYPVYLIEEHPEIHNSIRYPIEAVSEKYLSRISRSGQQVNYFTSSFCYMAALALYEGFDDIRIAGFDMGSETEYVYQKSGAEFWMGVISQYANLVLPEPTKLLKSKMYGFEGGQLVLPELVEEYLAFYLGEMDKANIPPMDDIKWVSTYLNDGAKTLCEEILKKHVMVSRQVLEGYKDKFEKKARNIAAQVNAINAQGVERRKLNPGDDTLLRNAFDKLRFVYRYSGAEQLAAKLIGEIDLQEVDKRIINKFVFSQNAGVERKTN